LELWKIALPMFFRSPVIGNGFNIMPYVGLEAKGNKFADTHNLYVKILAEQGLIGLVIFLFIIYKAVLTGWYVYRHSDDSFFQGIGFGMVVCCCSILITNFFGDRWTYIQLNAYFWVFIALLMREKANLMVVAPSAKEQE